VNRTAEHWRRHWLRRLQRRQLAERLLLPLGRLPGPAGRWATARLWRLALADHNDLAELRRLAERLQAEL